MIEVPDDILQTAVLSADPVATQPYPTEATRTRAIVKRALECLLNNGHITIVDPDQRRVYTVLDPPYEFAAPRKSRVGMWADHASGTLDPRQVTRDDGDTIWLDILGKESGPYPADNYTYTKRGD